MQLLPTERKRVDHLVKEVIKTYRRRCRDAYPWLSEAVRQAVMADAVIDIMKAQDNDALPISLFILVYHEAFDALFEDQ